MNEGIRRSSRQRRCPQRYQEENQEEQPNLCIGRHISDELLSRRCQNEQACFAAMDEEELEIHRSRQRLNEQARFTVMDEEELENHRSQPQARFAAMDKEELDTRRSRR